MNNSTPDSSRCPRCDGPIASDAPHGLCPRCLVGVPFETGTLPCDDPAAPVPAPGPETIAPDFPQLEILECLGRGGMGVVYKARQKSLGRLVALKLLAPERASDAAFAARFESEARVLAGLNHPNIVTIHDFGRAGGYYFLLMEFVDGVNLRRAMRSGRFTPEQALAIVPPVCEALQYAHDHGVVHRDIKPENLLIDRESRVKIADFGIAKMLHADGPDTGLDETRAGTPQYMAPEQQGSLRRTDHRADIYSLGVVLYELLTGELPADRLRAPSQKVKIDVRLDAIVLRALEKSPELRFANATEFRTSVETVMAGGGGKAAPPPVPPVSPVRFIQETKYAGFWRRAAALVIDYHIVLVVAFPLLVLLAILAPDFISIRNPFEHLLGHADPGFARRLSNSIGVNLADADRPLTDSTTLSCLLLLLYSAGMECTRWRASLGKLMMGLKVSDAEGRRLTFLRALGRNFAKCFSAFLCLGGFLAAAFTRKKQGLHDLLASTIVTVGVPADPASSGEDSVSGTADPASKSHGKDGCLAAVVIAVFSGLAVLGVIVAGLFLLRSRRSVMSSFPVATGVPALEARETSVTRQAPAGIGGPELRFVSLQRSEMATSPMKVWHPDGSPVVEASDHRDFERGTAFTTSASWTPEDLILRLDFSDPEIDRNSFIRVVVLDAQGRSLEQDPAKGMIVTSPRKPGAATGWFTRWLTLARVPKSASVFLEYGTGAWLDGREIPPDNTEEIGFGGRVSFDRIEDSPSGDGSVHATISLRRRDFESPDNQYDFVALTHDGRTLERTSATLGLLRRGVGYSSDIYHFPVKLSEVRAFRLRTRPVRRAEYKAVVLAPRFLHGSDVGGPVTPEEVGREWLSRLDAGAAAACWDDSADVFRALIAKDEWLRIRREFRREHAGVERRFGVETRVIPMSKGSSDRQVFVLRDRVEFSGDSTPMNEVLTLSLGDDRVWRVSGYSVTPESSDSDK